MVAGDYDKDGTVNCNYELEDDDVWVIVKCEEDCQPCLSDFEDKHRKGKKGKYLKDWE